MKALVLVAKKSELIKNAITLFICTLRRRRVFCRWIMCRSRKKSICRIRTIC